MLASEGGLVVDREKVLIGLFQNVGVGNESPGERLSATWASLTTGAILGLISEL